MRMLRIPLLALGLLAACPPIHAHPGQASEDEKIRITDLRLASSPEAAQGVAVFPEGTRDIFVSFNYAGGTNEPVTFVIAGRSGIEALRVTERYRGDGSAKVKISGSDMYRRLTQTLSEAVLAGQTNARDAATQAVGTQEYLMTAQYHVSRAQQALELLVQVELNAEIAKTRHGVEVEIAAIADLVAEALRLAPDDVQRKRTVAQKMAAPFSRAAAGAANLASGAGQIKDVAIPGSGTDRPGAPARNAYTLKIEVSGDISTSMEFWVQRVSKIYLPNTRVAYHEPTLP